MEDLGVEFGTYLWESKLTSVTLFEEGKINQPKLEPNGNTFVGSIGWKKETPLSLRQNLTNQIALSEFSSCTTICWNLYFL